MYLVELFRTNGFKDCYHEKRPDLDEEGVAYYLSDQRRHWLKILLLLTRKSVYLESSNRLFSLVPLLTEVFPNAKFIHLHRDGRDSMVSNFNKNNWPSLIQTSTRLRYNSELAGSKSLSGFERSCWYWRNMNQRIIDDLKGIDHLSLRFQDLITGNVAALEDYCGVSFQTKTTAPSNTKDDLKLPEKRYQSFSDFPAENIKQFEEICGNVQKAMGYI